MARDTPDQQRGVTSKCLACYILSLVAGLWSDTGLGKIVKYNITGIITAKLEYD